MGINKLYRYNINGFAMCIAIVFLFLSDNGYCVDTEGNKTSDGNKTNEKPQLRQPGAGIYNEINNIQNVNTPPGENKHQLRQPGGEPVHNTINNVQKVLTSQQLPNTQANPQNNNQNGGQPTLEQMNNMMKSFQEVLQKMQNGNGGGGGGGGGNNANNFPRGQSPLEQIFGIMGNVQRLIFPFFGPIPYANGNNNQYQSVMQSLIQQLFVLMSHFQSFLVNSNCVPSSGAPTRKGLKLRSSEDDQPYSSLNHIDQMLHDAEYGIHNYDLEAIKIPERGEGGFRLKEKNEKNQDFNNFPFSK